MNILEKITQNQAAFSKSEKKVAEVILANPHGHSFEYSNPR